MYSQHPLFNRIRKNQRQLKSFLKQSGISCYRLYDWDMPEFPLCVDVYENRLHVAVYKTRHVKDEAQHNAWLQECIGVLCECCQLSPQHLYLKTRERKKESGQYEKLNENKEFFVVQENGIKFLVNLNDYLDTGLFLDHRNTRQRVREASKGKQVLNLFSYTGAFSVYAAMGGAFGTTSVDLSNTYLKWARENFLLNNLPLPRHQFIKADVKHWIRQTPSKKYDIIVLDPPTISKSKMAESDFDVQNDHVMLINHTLEHLSDEGVLYFSNNYRGFGLHAAALNATQIQDISSESIPFDFRNKKIHACWMIRK